jgi:citrate lyase subunit beta/citryl-CoA lyase
MGDQFSEAGNRGGRVRSDCWVGLTLTQSGGIQVGMKSKVEVMYGKTNRQLVKDILEFFNLKHVRLEIEDSGAVPFVIMARLESAIKKLGQDKGKRYLPEWLFPAKPSSRERFRRSRLYLPGDQPKLFLNAAVHGADGLILDLEDSVPPNKKTDARVLVRNALRSIDFMDAERMVRINQLPLGLEDLEEIIPQKVDLILIPKVETPIQIYNIETKIDDLIANNKNINPDIFFMPIIESARGVINAYLIATASKRNVALAIGLEDYTADIGAQRSREGKESFFARSMVVNAARAAGIQAIDTVFSDVDDMEALRESVLEAKSLGFDGKGCIHPRQIAVVHDAFAPDETEIERAKKIVLAFDDAEKKGLGVVSLGSKMIDPPVVKRALKTIDLAKREGIIPEDWRNTDVK